MHTDSACIDLPLKPVVSEFRGVGAEWDPCFWFEFNRARGVTEADWQMVLGRVRRLRIPIVRIMMQMTWCRRPDGRFDFETPEMRSLYRYLDFCRDEGIEVMLNEWWWRPSLPVPPLADRAFSAAIAVYLRHLIVERGYECIRYCMLINEPNLLMSSGVFWENWHVAIRMLSEELERAGLRDRLQLLGPEHSHGDAWLVSCVHVLPDVLDGYTIHRYEFDAKVAAGDLETYYRRQWDYVRKHDPDGGRKWRMVTEAGMTDGMRGGAGNRNIGTPWYGLFMADYALQALRAGSQAILAWQLEDSSNEEFFWGMWGDKRDGFALRPWFYPWGLLTRYLPRGAVLYAPPAPNGACRVLLARHAAAAGEPAAWTVAVVNRGQNAVNLTIRLPATGSDRIDVYRFASDTAPVDAEGFPRPWRQACRSADGAVKLEAGGEAFTVAVVGEVAASGKPPG